MTTLLKNEFFRLFKTDDLNAFDNVGEDYVINESIEFTNETYNGKKVVTINRVIFKHDVIFDNVDIGVSLVFRNCVFEKSLQFCDIVSSGILDNINSNNFGLHFATCTFKDEVTFTGNNRIDRGISFKFNCKLEKGIKIYTLVVNEGSVDFADSTVDTIIDFSQCSLNGRDLMIKSCFIKGQIRISGGTYNSINFIKRTFERDILIWAPELTNLVFNYGNFEDEVRIQAIAGKPSLTMFSGKYNDKVIIDYEDKSNKLHQGFSSIYLESCEINNGIEVNGLQNMFSNTPIVETVQIKSSTRLKGDININNLDVGHIYMSGINQNATIKLSEIHVNRLVLDHFDNYSKVIFKNIRASYTDWFREIENKKLTEKVDSLFQLEYSNLGDTKFWGFNFDSFKNFSINNSILSSSEFFNVTWFNPEKIGLNNKRDIKLKLNTKNNNSISSVISDYKNRRDVYRQLKKAMFAQGDTIQGLNFKSLEMEAYHEQIKLEKPLCKIKTWQELGNRFSIYLNRISNLNGLDWTRPVSLILGITLIFYIVLVIQTNKSLHWSPAENCGDIKNTAIILWENGAIYFKLMDPTSKLNNILGVGDYINPGRLATFLYFFYKIILAYLIFQTIAAFRKYLK